MSQVARGGSDQQLAVIKKMKEDPSNIKSISSFVTDFTFIFGRGRAIPPPPSLGKVFKILNK